jgi:hypothetical protein
VVVCWCFLYIGHTLTAGEAVSLCFKLSRSVRTFAVAVKDRNEFNSWHCLLDKWKHHSFVPHLSHVKGFHHFEWIVIYREHYSSA